LLGAPSDPVLVSDPPARAAARPPPG